MEQKFFVPPDKAVWALALLRRSCRKDPEHPADQVNSLYFDTPELDQYEKSESGDYAKDKVRIRWYGTQPDPHRTGGAITAPSSNEPVTVWLELKSRRGFVSSKRRMPLEVASALLRYPALHRGILSKRDLYYGLAELGFLPQEQLVPVVAISYQRYRFVEPQTGFRVSYDFRIRSSLVLPGYGHGERALQLAGVVVEVKGPHFLVPSSLRELVEIGSSWTRYSKYSGSLDAHGMSPDEAARLWPAGVMPAWQVM